MSQQASSNAADVASAAVARDGQEIAPATPTQPPKAPELQVDVASLQSPDMEVDASGVLAPTTPAPNTLDAANKQQEEDLKSKYGVLPNRAALLRRDYQKEHRFVDSADQAMDKAGKVDPLRQPMTSKSALPPHMRNL